MAKIEALLWPVGDETATYAVLDGAGIPNLLDKLYDDNGPKFECLFSGEMAPDIAEVAPYLVKLERDSDFSQWVLSGWGNSWGIFVLAPAELEMPDLRRHLRKLNMVYDPNNKPLYFRWYDPRVLRTIFPTFEPDQLEATFGPVKQFVLEDESSKLVEAFYLINGTLAHQKLNII